MKNVKLVITYTVQPAVLNFQKTQSWTALNFCQNSGSLSCKIVLMKNLFRNMSQNVFLLED